MPKGLTLSAEKSYEVGEGKARENVSLTNDSAENILANTFDYRMMEIKTIQNAAKTVAPAGTILFCRDHIISELKNKNRITDSNTILKRAINGNAKRKGLRHETNVRINK